MAQSLMEIFHFTEADLVENRAGRLSAAQQKYMDEQNAGCTRWTGMITLLLAAGAVLTLILRLVTGENALLILTIILAVLTMIGGAVFAFTRQKTVYTLQKVQGKAQLTYERHQNPGDSINRATQSYTLVINGVKFNLSNAVYKLIQENASYTIYYVGEGFTHIVALEQTSA